MGNEHDPMGVVTSDRHLELDDPFPYTYKICAMCKETLAEDEMTRFRNGEYVCKDCLYDYVEDRGGEYVKEYIEKDIETIWDYYMEWWFENLPRMSSWLLSGRDTGKRSRRSLSSFTRRVIP